MTSLTGKQSRHLRALAHELEPVVLVGKEGASEGVITAVDQALSDHELVKVRLPDLPREEREAMAAQLAEGASASLAGTIGRIAILYRRHPSTPKINLPRG
ncbi:MAG: YhbY family RNA-binding protein [Sandaracinaceae bacterium]